MTSNNIIHKYKWIIPVSSNSLKRELEENHKSVSREKRFRWYDKARIFFIFLLVDLQTLPLNVTVIFWKVDKK